MIETIESAARSVNRPNSRDVQDMNEQLISLSFAGSDDHIGPYPGSLWIICRLPPFFEGLGKVEGSFQLTLSGMDCSSLDNPLPFFEVETSLHFKSSSGLFVELT